MCTEIDVRKDLSFIGISGKLQIKGKDAVKTYRVSMLFFRYLLYHKDATFYEPVKVVIICL